MDISLAFSYIFDDPDWIGKLAITIVVTMASILFTPFLVGLVGWALLLGYGVEIVRNVRRGSPRPLPRWNDYSQKIVSGGSVMVAGVIYNIPNLFTTVCLASISGALGEGLVGGSLQLIVLCCLLPFLLIYNLIVWPMLALGTGRFAESGETDEFFRFGDLMAALRRDAGATGQWLFYMFIINLVLLLFNIFPFVGQLAMLGLSMPVQMHLMGQFSYKIDAEKPKRKRA